MPIKSKANAGFVEPMECLAVGELPEGPEWTYEIKLDGFRLEAVKQGGEITLYSRRGNTLNQKFPYIAEALRKLPDSTVIDGELVALDDQGRSVFNLLQNFRSAESQIHYYGFDILTFKGKDLTQLPLAERRAILTKALPINTHISLSVVSHNGAAEMLRFAKENSLELCGWTCGRLERPLLPGQSRLAAMKETQVLQEVVPPWSRRASTLQAHLLDEQAHSSI